jgi:3-deoxy-7-phosphoheptulonate synthase
MIIVMRPEAGEAAIAAVEAKIRSHGLDVHISRGIERTLIGAVGDERKLDPAMFDPMPGVETSMHIVKPYKLVAREWHPANSVVSAGGVPVGGRTVQVIAGPCSVETQAQMDASAAAVAAGADGLLVEIHPSPKDAWCDADQALTPGEFSALMAQIRAVAQAVGRDV